MNKLNIMKGTKIMLAFTGTLFMTWMILSLLIFIFSNDITFKQSATGNVGILMIMFGWIPSLIVCIDISDIIDDKKFN